MIKRFLVFVAIFSVGYLLTGIILHYVKPSYKMLPHSFENILDGKPAFEDVSSQDFSALDYRLIFPENTDSTVSINFSTDYNDVAGIFCFRGNPQRTRASFGELNKKPISFRLDWEFTTAEDNRVTELGCWKGGSGWTGQPLYVEWPETLANQLFGVKKEFIKEGKLCEFVQGSLCGNIYFLDPVTGKETRPYLSIHNPIKGTVSIDPRMNGLLYVGQGIKNGERIGAYVFNMFTGKEIFFRVGLDPHARRQWGAYDSNPLIDISSGHWFHPAENGQIVKTLVANNTKIPRGTAFNYGSKKHKDLGIESSFGAYKNYGFFGDNGGNVFCLNLTTLQPFWYLDNYDDTDVAMVIDLQESQPYLYIGNEVDKQGPKGWAHIRKINALNGSEVWSIKRECVGTTVGGRVNSGGVLASIVTGKKKASNLVFGIFSRIKNSLKGELVALDKTSGKVVYSFEIPNYSWATPVDIYDKNGNAYLFFTDVFGGIYLMEAVSGKIIHQSKMPVVWESSPICVGNRIVVGARGNKIYSFLIE